MIPNPSASPNAVSRSLHGITLGPRGQSSWLHREYRRGRFPRFAAGGFVLSIDAAARVAFLYSFTVRPSFRRKGWGRRLLSHAIQKCTELGCDKLRFSVWPENDAAIGFYNHLGARRIENPEPSAYPGALGYQIVCGEHPKDLAAATASLPHE